MSPKSMPLPLEDTPESRGQLHAAIRDRGDERHILDLIVRGADPSVIQEGQNAYSLARNMGYPESFCQKMDDAFAPWLAALPDTQTVYITSNADTLWTCLREHGWKIWCQGTGQLGAFIWSTSFRLYYGPWVLEGHEFRAYRQLQVSLGLPSADRDVICHLLDEYGIVWALDSPWESS